jgi:phenylalanyl-tRNA synthetase alpha chain
LEAIAAGQADSVPEKDRGEYKKRKLVQEVIEKIYVIERGTGFTTSIERPETELTPEMLASGRWRTACFKPYNFAALGIAPAGGTLHPLLKVRQANQKNFDGLPVVAEFFF